MAETPPDKTKTAFAALEAALPAERIAFEVDLKRLCHPHCPVPFDYLKSRIAYGFLVACAVIAAVILGLGLEKIVLWWTLGIWTVVFWIGIRPILEKGIRRRIVGVLMEEPEQLEKIWRYGGVALVAPDGARAIAPQDDWRSFALRAQS
jgi:hypothetical protein